MAMENQPVTHPRINIHPLSTHYSFIIIILLVWACRYSTYNTSLRKVLAEHQRQDRHQLYQYIQTWPRSVLQRVSNRVAHHCCLVNLATFPHHLPHVPHQPRLNVFLRVVPSPSSVRSRDGHLHAADDGAREEADECFGAEEESKCEGSDCNLRYRGSTNRPGLTRSRSAAFVLIRTQALQSGGVVPSRMPGFSLIWRRTSSIMPSAAWPTDLMAMALKAQGTMAPKSRQVKTRGSLKETSFGIPNSSAVCRNAPQRANPTRVADPIAKPFPIAAVVFPAESSTSVRCLTTEGNSAISAIPPALSLTGPQLSIARQMGRLESMPRADSDTPQKPRELWLKQQTAQRTATGMMVEQQPRERPQMMLVAGPILQASDSSWTGWQVQLVMISVTYPMASPPRSPRARQRKGWL